MKLFYSFILFTLSFHLNAQEVTMFPGFFGIEYYQDDTRINKKSFQELMMNNPASREHIIKAKTFNTFSFVALGAEFTFLVLMLNSQDFNTFINMAVGAIGSAIFSVVLSQSSNFFKKKAILEYNQSLETTSLYIGPTANGIGLVYNF